MPPSTLYSQLTPAPWKHPSELAMVRDWFYPEHLPRSVPFSFAPSSPVDRRQDAINLVSLWRFRDPKLARSLVCTARLTDAVLHDQPGRRARLSHQALTSIYAMNFCRFVNALVDRDVRKSVTTAMVGTDERYDVRTGRPDSDAGPPPHRSQQQQSSSMYGHALALGLPESFVELRHQAIHEEMPSLEVWRMRTREALDWLWERWWKFNVKGSAEPALGEWEDKYGKWQVSGEGQTGAAEEDEDEDEDEGDPQVADLAFLCATCRKRRPSEQEGGDRLDSISGDEAAEEKSRNPDRRKRQRLNTNHDNAFSPPQQSLTSSSSLKGQEWTICFS